MTDWPTLLRQLRDREGLTREEVAARASIAAATVKAYELGQRHPSRDFLTAVLDALKADLHTRSLVLTSAGFAADERTHSERLPNAWFTFPEAIAEIERSPFPSHINNEVLDVVAANVVMQRVWEVDFRFDNRGPFELNFLSMLSDPKVANRIQNWDEAIRIALSVVKGHYGGDAAILGESNPYFAAAIQHFLQGDPVYVGRFLQIWATVEPRKQKLRWSYPVVWEHADVGRLSFHVQVNPADAIGSITFNDWIPIDEATWEGLRTLAESPLRGLRTFAAGSAEPPVLASDS